ncbi:PucR family transcriptional regulator [Paraliobacillus zengyii]|uniref:PucR family transcriptional regulator n=1 Tax=Paraliobacillus zengyii TaxID=2213194 RepID=UPI000DD4E3C9|nr:helix-turn-helix domain-containing protein [Paraliobacillus zengyii]
MLEKLKEVFPSLLWGKEDLTPKKGYLWFTTNNNEIIGIDKKEINTKEKQLLDTFLTPYYGNESPTNTNREKQWIQLLFENNKEKLEAPPDTYRFVYFTLSEPIDPLAFQEAIHGLFPDQVPIIWENQQEGVIIEESKPTLEEDTSYDQIIDVFMSDFYINILFYVGPFFTDLQKSPHYYQWIKKSFHTVHQYEKKTVMNYVTAVPYLVSASLLETDYIMMIDSILQDTDQDEELLKTIQIFLECNSNTSLAAKKMYMHRNSLQYRIDKFIEKTNIDVKQFEGALSVYLTLLLKKKLKQSM